MNNQSNEKIDVPQKIRLSLGTAILTGLEKGKLDANPTTAYLMTYKAGKCLSNCSFCPQAKSSKSNTELLSRVTWPIFETETATKALLATFKEGKIERVCIQALNYPSVFYDLTALVRELKKYSNVPVSVSCQPLNRKNIELLAGAGVNRIGIALDAGSEEVFDKIKGSGVGSSYQWDRQFALLAQAVAVFGRGNVSTHIIAGLGETQKEAVSLVQRCLDMGVLVALFAFTPVRGTSLEGSEQPSLASYRKLQLARHIIINGLGSIGDMRFGEKGELTNFGVTRKLFRNLIESGAPFQTSGCPDCNRPFYNEKPGGPLYNYPRKLTEKEIEENIKLLLEG